MNCSESLIYLFTFDIMKKCFPILLFSSLLLFSCNKKEESKVDNSVTACFTMDKTYPRLYELVNFSNCSKNYDRVEWNFGDGGYSTISDASYRYTIAGPYTVKLKTFNGVSSVDATKNIIVADEFKIHYDVKYTGAGILNGDLVKSTSYYSMKGKTGYIAFGSGGDYHQNKNGILQNSEFISNGTDIYTIKLVVKIYRGYKTQQSMMPDILFASDSLITEDIDPHTGVAQAISTRTLSMLSAEQNIYMTYK
jgi:PKD repeat protein